MKIGIDLRPLAGGESGGIAPHVKGVLEAMMRAHPEDHFHVFCTIFSRSLLDCDLPNVTARTFPAFNFYCQLDAVAADGGIDVLFRAFPTPGGPAFPMHRQIVVAPDLQHEAMSDFFDPEILRGRRKAFNLALSSAGAIGTSTRFGRKTILDHPWTLCRDVFLMPPALRHDQSHVERGDLTDAERALAPTGRYFFFPANLWPHKNHRRVLGAMRRVASRHPDVSLVLSGHPEGWTQLASDFADVPARHVGFVSARMLRHLYQHAMALCFFSLYEGFGMPLLEAFDAGCPVLCSNTTSLPEVAGDAALTVDPTDEPAIAAAMLRALDEPDLRRALIDRGRDRASLWDWRRSARNLHDACLRVAGRADRGEVIVTEPPRVSIVTPSYNQGRFLRRTIESVLTQDYPHIDYRVIDGGSTDESVEILQGYGDRFPWVSERDRGQTHAINKGFERADGRIRAYLNSDDVLKPGAVAAAVEYFRARPWIDMIYGRADYIDEFGGKIGDYPTSPYSFAHLVNECMVCQPATFWTRRIAERVGPFDESLHFGMDYDYWLRIDRFGGVIEHVDQSLAASRMYASNKTLSSREKVYAEVFAITRRHAGRTPLSYFAGLWHHRVAERSDTWAGKLRWLPGAHLQLALLHHKLHHGDWDSPRRLMRDGGAAIRHWLWTRRATQALFSRVGPLAALAERDRTVRGMHADNWIAPHAILTPRHPRRGATMRLCGTTPVETDLRVRAGGRTLIERHLAPGIEHRIEFTLPIGARRIELRFSHHVLDAVHRRLSFLVSDTNLFAESDWV